MDIKKIIDIQRIVRGFIQRKSLLIPSSKYQTKIWRKNQKWYLNGKKNECENYQIEMIEKIIRCKIKKTYLRINIRENILIDLKHPLKYKNGFDFTENFDGIININDKILLFNLKFVCDNGGAQTRTLREVYHFIESQYKLKSDYIFINILDGDTSYKHKNKFTNLNLYYKNKNVFVGDLNEFQNYFKSINKNEHIE